MLSAIFRVYFSVLPSRIRLYSGRVNDSVTPKEDAYRRHGHRRSDVLKSGQQHKHDSGQHKVDEILDKINRKGYNSLSQEEKDILMRASKEN